MWHNYALNYMVLIDNMPLVKYKSCLPNKFIKTGDQISVPGRSLSSWKIWQTQEHEDQDFKKEEVLCTLMQYFLSCWLNGYNQLSVKNRKGEKEREEQRKRKLGEGRKEKTKHIAHIKDKHCSWKLLFQFILHCILDKDRNLFLFLNHGKKKNFKSS